MKSQKHIKLQSTDFAVYFLILAQKLAYLDPLNGLHFFVLEIALRINDRFSQRLLSELTAC